MAGSFSNYAELKLLDHITGKLAFAKPTVWVALGSGTVDDAFTELAVADAYIRIETGASDWASATGTTPGATSNAAAITFVTASANWNSGNEIEEVALFDAVSGGNMLARASLTTPKTVLNGDTAQIPIGDLDLTLD